MPGIVQHGTVRPIDRWVIVGDGRGVGSGRALENERGFAGKICTMPIISMFFGIIVSMYFLDNRRHKQPHVHVKYQDQEAVVSVPEGDLLEGRIPPAKMRLVLAWIEIHKDELMADWDLAASGQHPFKIDPLR